MGFKLLLKITVLLINEAVKDKIIIVLEGKMAWGSVRDGELSQSVKLVRNAE